MISLLVPTRGRPDRFRTMLASARQHAVGPFEVIAWLDEDDPARHEYPDAPDVRYGSGPRPYVDGVLCTSGLWTKAWELATGDIAFMGADDIVFRTARWDEKVRQAFSRVPDQILMAYPNDGTRRRAPVNPFVSRRWIETAGFTPERWPGWFADEWIWSIAAELRRVVALNVRVPHLQRAGSDETYRDGQAARESMGGLDGLRARFYSAEMTALRDEQTERLRAVMGPERFAPQPIPGWFRESIEGSKVARGALPTTKDTLVVVHCYAGDGDLVRAFLPQYLHHGSDVLILSPTDAPVEIDHPGVECRQAGKAAYFGQASLDRQRAHLELLLTYPHTFFLCNDADSMCLSPEIPAYLYEEPDVVWSNEVKETRPHKSPYPKIAFHPPYFLSRQSIERMLAVPADKAKAHPITPFIDHMMVVLTCEAGLQHRSYPDGKSFPAWRHGAIPETKELGHNYVHVQEAKGSDGAGKMRQAVRRGAVMVHSIKHPPVRDLLVADHARYAKVRSRRT